MQVGDKMYRYFDAVCTEDDEFLATFGDSAELQITEYVVRKVTNCGVWINQGCYAWGKLRFVNLGCIKTYAHPTKEEAFNSFVIRKRRQVKILTAQLERAKFNLELAEKGFQP